MTRAGDKSAAVRRELLEKVKQQLDAGKPVRALGLSADERALLHELHLLTIKPMMYIANVKEDGFDNNPLLEQIQAYAAEESAQVVAVSAAIEAELANLDPADQLEFLQEYGLTEPGLNRVINAGYQLLGLLTYFTAGKKEVRAWTVREGSTAPQAAGVIHTDFERGFIRAEVISFADFIALGGEQGAKEAGRMRLEGKEYIVHEGDIMHFRFNV